MKEKLIAYFKRQELYMERSEDKKVFFDHCFGALDFAMSVTNDWDKEAELIDLWNNGWKQRLEEKVYGNL